MESKTSITLTKPPRLWSRERCIGSSQPVCPCYPFAPGRCAVTRRSRHGGHTDRGPGGAAMTGLLPGRQPSRCPGWSPTPVQPVPATTVPARQSSRCHLPMRCVCS